MNEQTIGSRIAEKRKAAGLKQDEVAERLGVSPQAVSKWENDVSCPDISLLPAIANLFGCTVDALLGNEKAPVVQITSPETRKPLEQLMLRIRVFSKDGDKVNVNLPLSLVKTGISCIQMGDKGSVMDRINIDEILMLVEKGLVGKLIEVESADGDTVEVFVE